MSNFVYAPPQPPLFAASSGGGATASSQPQQGSSYSDDNNNNAYVTGYTSPSPPSPSSSSTPTSVSSFLIIVIIVISFAIIVSASIYILLRFFSRRSYAAADDDVVVTRSSNATSATRGDLRLSSSESALLEALPLFTFGSVTGNLTGGDCAVCLSKFELHDQLRLLPLCCHAFHARCIDTWLSNNQTCPLCRSTVYPTDADVLNKILSVSSNDNNNNQGIHSRNTSNGSSFRIEIGSVSRRQGLPENVASDGRRSYSIGSYDYIVDGDGYEVEIGSTHRRGASECTSVDKESAPAENLAADVGGGGRSWLRDYVDRLSSRAMSFGSSGRFFSGSSRRSDVVVPVDEDLEAHRMGEEISELFRWFSGV